MEKFIKELKKANENKSKMIQAKEKKENEITSMILAGTDSLSRFSKEAITKRHNNKKVFESEITACNDDILKLDEEIKIINIYIKALKNQIITAAANIYFMELLKNEKFFNIPARYKKVKDFLPEELKNDFYITINEYRLTLEISARINNDIFKECDFNYEDNCKEYYIENYNKNEDFFLDKEKVEKITDEYKKIDPEELYSMCARHYEAKKEIAKKIEAYENEISEIKSNACVPGIPFDSKEVHF